MSERGHLGAIGEEMVADYYRDNGYYIVKQNYHSRRGEIDIIAENETTVAFIEVKLRHYNDETRPLNAVDYSKVAKVRYTARSYMYKSHSVGKMQPRFDIAEVTVVNEETNEIVINVIENAF